MFRNSLAWQRNALSEKRQFLGPVLGRPSLLDQVLPQPVVENGRSHVQGTAAERLSVSPKYSYRSLPAPTTLVLWVS